MKFRSSFLFTRLAALTAGAMMTTAHAATVAANAAKVPDLSGSWDCVIEEFNFKEKLELGKDGQYTEEVNMFGKLLGQKGTWASDGKKLVLSRKKNIEQGKERDDPFPFDLVLELSDVTHSSFRTSNKDGGGGVTLRRCQRK